MASYNDVVEGLKIFARYELAGMESNRVHAEHDEISAGPDARAVISTEDLARLDQLGWFFSTQYESWLKFT